jgi:hypothetical protein
MELKKCFELLKLLLGRILIIYPLGKLTFLWVFAVYIRDSVWSMDFPSLNVPDTYLCHCHSDGSVVMDNEESICWCWGRLFPGNGEVMCGLFVIEKMNMKCDILVKHLEGWWQCSAFLLPVGGTWKYSFVLNGNYKGLGVCDLVLSIFHWARNDTGCLPLSAQWDAVFTTKHLMVQHGDTPSYYHATQRILIILGQI